MRAEKEPIMESRRALMAFAALLPWVSRFAQAEPGVPTIPPARAFKWDISRANSSIIQEFIVEEYGMYNVKLGFGGLDAIEENGYIRKNSDQSWRKQLGENAPSPPYDGPLSKFLGTGKGIIYENDPGTNEVATGVIVPVRVKVEILDAFDNSPREIFSRNIFTAGFEGGGYMLSRPILKGFGIPLKPGKYTITASTLRDSLVPQGITTYLLISVPAKVSPPKDTE